MERRKRGEPLTASVWQALIGPDGAILDPEFVKGIIFQGVSVWSTVDTCHCQTPLKLSTVCWKLQGISHELRIDVWKYLLGYYPWSSTKSEREDLRRQKVYVHLSAFATE